MKSTGYRLLKLLAKERELDLKDIIDLVPKKFNDFRDFYSIAGLISRGYLGITLTNAEGEQDKDERFLASAIYAKTMGEETHDCNDFTAINDSDALTDIAFYATAKTDLYLAEIWERRKDRIISAFVAVLVGVSSAVITLLVKQFLTSP